MRFKNFSVFCAGMGFLLVGIAHAEELRFDCTNSGLENERFTAQVVAVVSVEEVGPKSPVAVKVDVESITLFKKGYLAEQKQVGVERALKFAGTYGLAPRNLPKQDRKGRDLVLAPEPGQQTVIKELHLSTLSQASYVVTNKGAVFATDCTLDPM
ncbi:MAG TPA: hypothetical protein DCS07_13305 [Bdellovibrionales bacterium]|nr:MAG: hypothetical protein A2Z97_09145 [Bdellovibrionales bacterium GWB1_52_6]OFZ05406.1 MAG: hypothetical protein A2X97_11025 [Bdellovibrionales bacterium GWA1_52_35]HAR43584.1 hypothetical protein [Bdellovibrionales bacterium]HCM41677.1 hypothetical protein [Bdellovibrionales bacterium]